MDVYKRDLLYKNIKPEDRIELLKILNRYIDDVYNKSDEINVGFIVLNPPHRDVPQIIPGRMSATRFYPHKELEHVIVMEVIPTFFSINIDINTLESIRVNEGSRNDITIYFNGEYEGDYL